MTATPERVFWEVVDDLNQGRGQPVERYLELVPASEREELAQLLAMFFASRSPQSPCESLDPDAYGTALDAIDRVRGDGGPSGVLPKALSELRRNRGMKRQQLIDLLANQFEIPATARTSLARYYHLLETGRLAGDRISRRLLAALADVFGTDSEDFVSASEPTRREHSPGATPVFARSEQAPVARTPRDGEQTESPDEELVSRLFTGGRDS